ncbi:MAG: hypothetical protein VXY92_11470 [Planctomycetota bacterium]|nr:hypothetical protein [Planctomycetota bacterium]
MTVGSAGGQAAGDGERGAAGAPEWVWLVHGLVVVSAAAPKSKAR